MGVLSFIFQDRKANGSNTKGKFILTLFRIANGCSKRRWLFYPGLPYLIFYRFFVEWVLGIELPWNLKAGPGLVLYHGQGLVINSAVIIGSNCVLRHCTTIGNAVDGGGCPVIEDGVNVGANVIIVGAVTVGRNSVIGAGTVITKSIPPGSVVVGNPAKIIRSIPEIQQ